VNVAGRLLRMAFDGNAGLLRVGILAIVTVSLDYGRSVAEVPTVKSLAPKLFADPDVAELAVAAALDDVKEIDRLVAKGVDVNATSNDGLKTPLYFVIDRNTWLGPTATMTGVQRLLEHGANPNFHVVCGGRTTSADAEQAFSGGQASWAVLYRALHNESGSESEPIGWKIR
jgi:hypothetical protein